MFAAMSPSHVCGREGEGGRTANRMARRGDEAPAPMLIRSCQPIRWGFIYNK